MTSRLASTIEFECPWLVPKSSTSIPIPLNPPSTFFPRKYRSSLLYSLLSLSLLLLLFNLSLPLLVLSIILTFFCVVNTVPGVGELMYVSFPVDNRIIFQHAWFVLPTVLFLLLNILFHLLCSSSSFLYFCNFLLLLFLCLLFVFRWLGEKYDGVRCCWNPRSRTLYPSKSSM